MEGVKKKKIFVCYSGLINFFFQKKKKLHRQETLLIRDNVLGESSAIKEFKKVIVVFCLKGTHFGVK